MKLTLNDYRVLPIREKINLFLNMSNKNQTLTDISGVNNSKIAHLKKYPESISNLQLRNVEKLENAFVLCVKAGKINLETKEDVLKQFSLPKNKDKYVTKVINSITNYKVDGKIILPMDKKNFVKKYKNDLKNKLTLANPDYNITVENETLSELYVYNFIFHIHLKPYPTSNTKVILRIDGELTKLPKACKFSLDK